MYFFRKCRNISSCCRFPALCLLFWCLFYYLVCCFPLYFNQHFKQMLKWSWNKHSLYVFAVLLCPVTMFSLLLLNLKSKKKKKCSFDVAINTVLQHSPFCFYPFIKTCKNALAFAILTLLLRGYIFSDEKETRSTLMHTTRASMLVNTMMKNDTYQLKIKCCLFKSIFKHF